MTISSQHQTRGFVAIRRPSEHDIEQVAALAPHNPFHSAGYLHAREALGGEPWLMGIRSDGPTQQWIAGCPAFLMTGRVNRCLEIPSWPQLQDMPPFWDGLLALCREHRVSRLELNSFASRPSPFPCQAGDGRQGVRKAAMVFRRRSEYVLALDGGDALGRFSSNHARNVKRARKAGISLRRATDMEACRRHVELMSASLTRRQDRGETVNRTALRTIAALVSHGAGLLFQALEGDQVVSSILVLRSPRTGYYHSAGTSPQGMACGASHFLVHQITEQLRAEGLEQFNLGGADAANTGLERFKTGFGAVPVELDAADVLLAGVVRRALAKLGRSLDRVNSRVRELSIRSLTLGRWEAWR